MSLAITPQIERLVDFIGTFALLAGLALGAAMFVTQSI